MEVLGSSVYSLAGFSGDSDHFWRGTPLKDLGLIFVGVDLRSQSRKPKTSGNRAPKTLPPAPEALVGHRTHAVWAARSGGWAGRPKWGTADQSAKRAMVNAHHPALLLS